MQYWWLRYGLRFTAILYINIGLEDVVDPCGTSPMRECDTQKRSILSFMHDAQYVPLVQQCGDTLLWVFDPLTWCRCRWTLCLHELASAVLLTFIYMRRWRCFLSAEGH